MSEKEIPLIAGILALVLNLFLLIGVGTMVWGALMNDGSALTRGILQLALAVAGVVLGVCTFGLGLLATLAAWVWALVDGVVLLVRGLQTYGATPPPKIPPNITP